MVEVAAENKPLKRPLYETPEHLAREFNVAQAIEEALSSTLHKLPHKYNADYAAFRDDKLQSWIEIKCRDVESTAFPTVMLSLDKWLKIRWLAHATGVKFTLVVEFRDGIYWTDETDKVRPIAFLGRSDRNDWQDMEPSVRIPLSEFKPLRRK